MLKKILVFLCFFFIFSAPLRAENNKVGIHILEPTEVEKASQLVNSTGGDWGYVTIVLRDDDLDKTKWQKFMDDCRQLHLIPIVRLATHTQPSGWAKPENLSQWPDFLNSLNWPTKEQIVIVFNEPNHAKEWGGEINPQEYATILEKMINLFKEKNNNFQVLPAGLDQAADGNKGTMREETFLQQMEQANPEIFNKIDGWASHSYPNHGYIGKPTDTGKRSIKGYQWELNFLNQLNPIKDLPIYITETGWPYGGSYYPEEKTAEFITQALDIWQTDEKVKAITPFVLNYPAIPFDQFSWLKEDGQPTEQYQKVLGVGKTKGEPEQIEAYKIISLRLAEILPINYQYKGKVKIENTGQWIMGERNKLPLNIKSDNPNLEITEEEIKELTKPGETTEINFEIKTGTKSGEQTITIANQEQTIYTFKPFELRNKKVNLWQQIKTKIKLWWLDFRNK